jgi:hypothetical protein
MSLILNGDTGVSKVQSGVVEDGDLVNAPYKIVLGTGVSATGTSVDFTGIPSWAKRITIMFNGVSTNGTSVPLIRLGAGSIDIGTYNCVVSALSPASAAATMSNGFGLAVTGTSAANIFYGQSILTLMGSNVWTMQGILAYPSVSQQFTAGSKTLSSTLDRIRITTVNGTDTFDAGTINIMYEG